jgi:hypothetical protein
MVSRSISIQNEDMTKIPERPDWPPPGMSTWYRVDEKIDGQPDRYYDLVLPSTFSQVDLSTVRLGRHGGPSEEDLLFRRELYEKVGAVVVAAGHVETAMKRLILLLEGEPEAHFSLVDKNWTDLHNRLRILADGTSERRIELGDALDWAKAEQLKRRRDNVVHSYWWIYAGLGARRSRFYRRTDGTTIDATLVDVGEDADLLFEYAERLDALLGSDWIIARLPRMSE